MTAEVAVLNSSPVAPASISAATVDAGNSGRRILRKSGISAQALFAGALVLSLIAHGWVLALLLHSPARELGSVDVTTNAISVNLETTDVIDAMESAAAKEAASSPAGAKQKAISETREKSEEAANREAEAAALKAEETARQAAQADAERQRIEDEAEIVKRIKEAAAREETRRQAEEAATKRKLRKRSLKSRGKAPLPGVLAQSEPKMLRNPAAGCPRARDRSSITAPASAR